MKQKKSVNDQQTAPQEPVVDPKVTALEADLASLKTGLARAMADYQNLEKRYERESSTVIKFANASLLERLLEIRDHLSQASAHVKDPSLAMILSSFDRLLSDEGVVTIDASGEFDPAAMECQETVPGEKGKVISVVRQGYKLHDRILRTARVTVGDGISTKVSPAQEASETSV